MAIKTERPDGGDGRVLVFKARSPDEARKARAALVAAGVEPEFPEEVIDAYFQPGVKPLPVRVPLKDAAKGLKAIDGAFPRVEAPPKTEAEKKAEAEAQVAAHDPSPELATAPPPPTKDPPTAVDRAALRALHIVLISIMLPGAGVLPALIGAAYGHAVSQEIRLRPDETFRNLSKARVAFWLGLLLALGHGAAVVGFLFRRQLLDDY